MKDRYPSYLVLGECNVVDSYGVYYVNVYELAQRSKNREETKQMLGETDSTIVVTQLSTFRDVAASNIGSTIRNEYCKVNQYGLRDIIGIIDGESDHHRL